MISRTMAFGALLATAAPALAAGECPDLTGLQVAAGFVTWLNVLSVFAVVIAVACVSVLLKEWFAFLLAAFAAIPVQVYEVLGYGLSLALVASGMWLAPADRLWPVFGGSLLFGGMLAITSQVHKLKGGAAGFHGILFAAWTAVAFAYGDSLVGFIAVLAFMGMLGFSAAVIPMGFAVGFTDKDAVPRATSAAFLTTLAGTGWYLARGMDPANPLLEGALWLGPMVLFLGLLITASSWYATRTPYAVRQIGPFALGIAGMMVGATYGVPHLAGIAGTFLVLYLIEKAADIPARSLTGYAAIGLVVSALIGGGVYWAQRHMDLIQPYLLF
jgi:hypothetical protein